MGLERAEKMSGRECECLWVDECVFVGAGVFMCGCVFLCIGMYVPLCGQLCGDQRTTWSGFLP